jgi:putative ABC transport system permease protein
LSRAASANRSQGLTVKTWRDLAVFYQAVRALYNRIFGILGVIMICIVLFAMSNTLGMAVVERTREIGTLRAIGTLPSEIVRNFVFEGMAIGAAGAVAGMLLAGAATVALLFAGSKCRRRRGVPSAIRCSSAFHRCCMAPSP